MSARQVWTVTALGSPVVAGSVVKYVGATALSMGATRARPVAYAAHPINPDAWSVACATFTDARAYLIREYGR